MYAMLATSFRMTVTSSRSRQWRVLDVDWSPERSNGCCDSLQRPKNARARERNVACEMRGREGGEKEGATERERYRVAKARHEREDSLVENGGTRFSISLHLSLSLFLSRSTKKGCQMHYRRLELFRGFGASTNATSCW